MSIHVVRHADAGDRSTWNGPDRDRPLTPRGHEQAQALAARLSQLGAIGAVFTSPLVRCVETVTPAARLAGQVAQAHPAWAEGAAHERTIKHLRELTAEHGDTPIVVCSHGDVIGSLVLGMQALGIRQPAQLQWQKASVWTLHTEHGAFIDATYAAPPAV